MPLPDATSLQAGTRFRDTSRGEAAMDHERFSRGWWAATFADSAQEMRFRRAALRNGRFAGFMALSAISVMLGVVYLLLVTARLVEPSATGVVAVALLFGAGSVAAVALLRARRPRSTFRAIVLAVALLTVVVTLFLFSGLAGGAPGVILVFGGVVVIHLSVPAPTLSADIAPALAYSAATLPAYLIADGPAPSTPGSRWRRSSPPRCWGRSRRGGGSGIGASCSRRPRSWPGCPPSTR